MLARLQAEQCFFRGRSVKKMCRWHIFSVGLDSYAARGRLESPEKTDFI